MSQHLQYVARVRLSDRFDRTLADVGETCERVPASSLPWLIEQGLVAQVERHVAPVPDAGRRSDEP